ncbi:MAG: hypothetical protein KDB79_07850, partial [Acidobacteria bacterium]|nr:hypothetical protein [Acidobacteriota bacterium]
VEKPLMVISNGELVDTKDNADGTRTFHYKTEKPYPNYLTSFAVGEYIDITQRSGDTEIHTFGYPDEKDGIEATIVRLPEMVNYFSQVTGVKYPFRRYSQVTVQDYIFPGFVGQNTAATMSDNMIDDHGTHEDFRYLWDGVEAQSLASQWFGNLMTPREWRDVWLNQSFSHYFDELFNIHKNGNDEFLTYSHSNDQSTDLSVWKSGYRRPVVTRNYNDLDVFSTDNYATIRGTLVLHMLRKQLGDANWWRAIRHYVRSNADKQVSTEDLRIAIEETTGESIGWFFDQWLYKMGHPIFEITKNYDESKKQLLLKVKQIQKIDPNDGYPQVEYFQGKLEIEIDDEIRQVWLKPQEQNIFTFKRDERPKFVNFDHENTWIKEVKFEKSQTELLYQLRNSTDILAKREAINELSMIAQNEKTVAKDRSQILSALREIALGDSYWRLRIGALSQLQSIAVKTSGEKPLELDDETTSMLLTIIDKEGSWLRASAINFLGMTKQANFADVYIDAFNDKSDRVINSAAKALGKSKSRKAFSALVKLRERPSWKSQSLISTLDGLKELGDPRGIDIALEALNDKELPRWWLATPIWDYPITAVDTLVALGKPEAAYPILLKRFKMSIEDNDLNDIFSNVLLIARLGDPRSKEVFEILKTEFKDDENAMQAVVQYEKQFEQTQ